MSAFNQSAAQLELFEPGEYLDTNSPGYFSILTKPGGNAKQQSYELWKLPKVIDCLDRKLDTWISQAVFNTKNRRAVNMRHVGLMFADLDTYNSDYKLLNPEDQAHQLNEFCRAEGLPTPSIVLFSGRGLQPKWLLTEAQTAINLCSWNEVQNALINWLAPFAADVNAKDISRVLRLDHTVNTKSGLSCRVVYVTGGNEDCPARYDFNELRKLLLSKPCQVETKNKNGKILNYPESNLAFTNQVYEKKLKIKNFSFQSLNWTRQIDIRELWRLRGGVPEGYRMTTLFWLLNFLVRAQPVMPSKLFNEAAALAREIDPINSFYKNSDLSTLYRKAKENLQGAKVDFHGHDYPPLYTPRNDTLINIFRITSDEEKHMKTIISRAEKDRRWNEARAARRRAAGIHDRETYESQSLSALKPWEKQGISRAWWYRTRHKVDK